MTKRFRRKRHKQNKWTQNRTRQAGPSPTRKAVTYGNSYTFSMCRHWQDEFKLEEGLSILCSAWSDSPKQFTHPQVERAKIDFGVYFDEFWGGNVLVSPGFQRFGLPWEDSTDIRRVMFRWPDRSAPANMVDFEKLVYWILERLRKNDTIEIGCFAGHGRTGTMLAGLLVGQGVEPLEAMRRVRRDHCVESIETDAQVQFVVRFARKQDFEVGDGQEVLFSPSKPTAPTTPTGLNETAHRLDDDKFCLDHMSFDCWFGPNQGFQTESKPDLVTIRKDTTDDEDYEEWLKLNTVGLLRDKVKDSDGWQQRDIEAIVEEYFENRKTDITPAGLECVDPPCLYPGQCDLAEGECFKAKVVKNTVVGEEWEEW